MSALTSPEFLLTSLIVVASPGTGVIYTLGAGLGRGARAATGPGGRGASMRPQWWGRWRRKGRWSAS